MPEIEHSCANCFTPEAIERANAHVAHLQANLDITNADHIALWLEEHLNDDTGLGWLACRIVEAHERSTQTSANRITSLEEEISRLKSEDYKSFTDGMEAAAQICGSLAETTYDDADEFRAATGCEAAIMGVVRQQRDEQARVAVARKQEQQ